MYPKVKILADSIYGNSPRLTTFELTYWRPLLPEMNTHRVFSRGAGSSRAQNFVKRCEQVKINAWLPEHWNAEKPGMVGGEEFDDETKLEIAESIQKLGGIVSDYLLELDQKIFQKTGYGIHKQYLNRYLEPFVPVTQIVTGTSWKNFYTLRRASDAQPEIRDVANEMYDLMYRSKPKYQPCHLPYVTEEELKEYGIETCLKISVARCARVSYRAYDANTMLEKDLALFDRLRKSGHMSPFEHIAVAFGGKYFNLDGWMSYRYVLELDDRAEGSGEKIFALLAGH